MKTTFEELKIRATKGPFRVGDSGFTVFGPKTENPSPETVCRCMASNVTGKANADAITRLLNAFVAGDGLQVLRDVSVCFSANGTPSPSLENRISALIAQLDGHANTEAEVKDESCEGCRFRHYVQAAPLGYTMSSSGWGCSCSGGHAIKRCSEYST